MNIGMNIGMNPVSVSNRYIGTWYRFDMEDFGDIGIGLIYSPNRYRCIGIGISVSVEL